MNDTPPPLTDGEWADRIVTAVNHGLRFAEADPDSVLPETVKAVLAAVQPELGQLRAANEQARTELNETSPRAWCQCCVFGNHTEPCTCAAATCCHPERHTAPNAAHLVRLAAAVDDLHGRLDDIEALCDTAESDALGPWENPLPVPAWAVNVRAICRREPAAVAVEA